MATRLTSSSIPARNIGALRAVCSAVFVVFSGLSAAQSLPPLPPPPPLPQTSGSVVLNFVETDIEAVARALGAMSNRYVVVDPRVKGTLTLISERPTSVQTALERFAQELQVRGYALVDSFGVLKVLPEADAKLQAGPVLSEGQQVRGGQLVTKIFKLQHENPNNVLPIIRPLVNPNNPISVNAGNNALVITDYSDNLQRIGKVIESLDQPAGHEIEIVSLQHALASDVVPLLQRMLDVGQGQAQAAGASAAPTPQLIISSEPRSNAILVRAPNAARMSLIKSLIERLDRPAIGGASNIHVVYLRHANAAELAKTLRAAIGGEAVSARAATTGASASATTTNASGAAASAVTTAAGNAGALTVQADSASNALIITAPEPVFRQLRGVIDQLDTRRAQVYVESLIAEVSADKVSEIGVQWQTLLGRGNVVAPVGLNFGSGGANILNLAAQAGGVVLPAAGLNLGLAQKINGVYVLSMLARFLESTGEANILSTPNLLTLDNEEAKIVIGQNVPFVTGQYTANNSNQGAVNPFQTIERKDVGLTLRVKPQISDNGTIKMQIFQEVSSVVPSSVAASTGPITNKRTIESTVLVDDGGVVVLGGLLQDEFAGNTDKVPVLGDAPIFGGLFRSEKRSRKKTNLMVFLRPVIVRDAQQTNSLAVDRYDLMRVTQQNAQPAASDLHSINAAPVLPALAPWLLPSAPVQGSGKNSDETGTAARAGEGQ